MICLFLIFLADGLSGGRLFKILSPYKESIIGRGLCIIGGYIANPFLTIGGLKIPYISTDDVLFATILTAGLVGLVLRKKIHSMKRLLIATLLVWVIFWWAYKLTGVVMIWYAEKVYGLKECAEVIDLGLFKIQYAWFNLLFVIGSVIGIFGLVGMLIKVWMDKT